MAKRIRFFIPFLVVALLSALAWWVPSWLPGWYASASRLLDEHFLFVIVLSVSLVLLLFWVFFWKLPEREVTYIFNAKERLDLKLKSRQTYLQFVGGAALLGGLYFTAQTLRTSQGTLQTAQEGQITERFTKAIEQLGRDNLSIRLGGIYALERIARDSAKDHWPVMQVLTAYVRERAPVQEQPLDTTVKDGKKQDAPRTKGCEIKSVRTFEDILPAIGLHGKLPTDIQAILTVLSYRGRSYGNGEIYPLDLRNTQLPTARLDNAKLQGAVLIGVHLQDAYLLGANLQGTLLMGAHLQGAELSNAQLHSAHLTGAYLQDACLRAAEFRFTELIQTHLERADLREADFQGAGLWKTQLQGADLRGAKHLTQKQVEMACVDEHTQLPEGFSRPVPCPTSQP